MAVVMAVGALAMAGCASWSKPSPICLGGVAIDDGGVCPAAVATDHHLPFRSDVETQVSQAFYGYETHQGDLAYAVDFSCAPGQPITASKDGVVWAVRQDSNEGCAEDRCVEDANYVVIDHGDGTYSTYFHLQHRGAIVDTGDQVCAGEVIGLCGATGFATGTHLHFSVRDRSWRSIPVRFEELADRSPAVILPREEYRSENIRQSGCASTSWSTLGRDAFAHRGILRDETMASVIKEDESRSWRIEGTYSGELERIAIHRRAPGEREWMTQCADIDDRGRFSVNLHWPEEVFSQEYYFMMMTGADGNCRAPGWSWAYRIRMIGGEEADASSPGSQRTGREEPVLPEP